MAGDKEMVLVDTIKSARAGVLEANGGDMTAFSRECEWAMQQLRRNSFTADIARANGPSLRDAIIQAAAAGTSLNPILNHAYLVPRDRAICLDVGYRGLRDTAVADGLVMWVRAEAVFEKDDFELTTMMNGDRIVTHKFHPFATDRGKLIGGYCEWVDTNDHRDAIMESIQELYDSHRSRSEAWRSKKAGIWKTDELEAIRKSLIKRAHKSWPRIAGMGLRFDAAVAAAIQADGDTLASEDTTIDAARAEAIKKAGGENCDKWARFYKVEDLSELRTEQADDMERRLAAHAKKEAMKAEKAKQEQAEAPTDEPAPKEPTKKAAAKQDKPAPSAKLPELWGEIDEKLQVLSGGDRARSQEMEEMARAENGLPEGELDLAQVVKLHGVIMGLGK